MISVHKIRYEKILPLAVSSSSSFGAFQCRESPPELPIEIRIRLETEEKEKFTASSRADGNLVLLEVERRTTKTSISML